MIKQDWIINLEDLSSQVDIEQVKFICGKHNAKDIYSLSSCDYQDVWSELFQYAIDGND